MNEPENDAVDLSYLDEEFGKAEAASGGGEVPDGKYPTFVEKVAIRKSQAGNAYLNWQLRICEGEYAGRVLFTRSMLSKENAAYLKRDLEFAGLKLTKLSDLAKSLDQLLDAKMVVRSRTREKDGQTFNDVYLSKKTGTITAEEKAALAAKKPAKASGGDAGGDSLPF